MKWITRKDIKVDRVACPWLIKKFVDPQAEFLFVEEKNLIEQARMQDAIPFDAPKLDPAPKPGSGFSQRCGIFAFAGGGPTGRRVGYLPFSPRAIILSDRTCRCDWTGWLGSSNNRCELRCGPPGT